MNTLTAQEAKEQLLDLIAVSTRDHLQYRITSPEGTVVMLPWETYENLLVTLELLSTPCMMEGLKDDEHPNCCHDEHSCC